MYICYNYAVTAKDVYMNFDEKCLDYVGYHKKRAAIVIFNDFMRRILYDVVMEDIEFIYNNLRIYMAELDYNSVKNIKRNKGLVDLDFLKTNFSGYRITVKYKNSIGILSKSVYYGSMQRIIDEFSNNGRRYILKYSKTYEDYVELLSDKFKIDEKNISLMLKYGLKKLCYLFYIGCDYSIYINSSSKIEEKWNKNPILIGQLHSDPKKQYINLLTKYYNKIKYRINSIYYPYEGHWIPITEEQYLNYVKTKEINLKIYRAYNFIDVARIRNPKYLYFLNIYCYLKLKFFKGYNLKLYGELNIKIVDKIKLTDLTVGFQHKLRTEWTPR